MESPDIQSEQSRSSQFFWQNHIVATRQSKNQVKPQLFGVIMTNVENVVQNCRVEKLEIFKN